MDDTVQALHKRITDLEIKILQLHDLHIDKSRSIEIEKLAESFALAQGEMDAAAKSKKSNFGRYSSYGDAVEASREALSKNGLSVYHELIRTPEKEILCKTIMLHKSGQFISSLNELILPDNYDSKQFKGAATYAKKTAYEGLVGVIVEEGEDNQKLLHSSKVPAFKNTLVGTTIEYKPEYITKEQEELLQQELDGHPDIVQLLYDKGNITSISELKKESFKGALEFARKNVAAKNNQGK